MIEFVDNHFDHYYMTKQDLPSSTGDLPIGGGGGELLTIDSGRDN